MESKTVRVRVRFGTLFPEDNEVARWMIPVFILRSDINLELRVIGANDKVIHLLHDSTGVAEEFHARAYFFRGTLRSLYSARAVIKALMGISEFKEMLANANVRDRFDKLNKDLNRAADQFEPLRNTIGGHVEGSVRETLSVFGETDELEIEATPKGLTSATVSSPFVVAALFGKEALHDPDLNEAPPLMDTMSNVGESCLLLLDLIAQTYLHYRGLFTE